VAVKVTVGAGAPPVASCAWVNSTSVLAVLLATQTLPELSMAMADGVLSVVPAPDTVLVGATLPVDPGAKDRTPDPVMLSTYMVLGAVGVVAAPELPAPMTRTEAAIMPPVRATAANREMAVRRGPPGPDRRVGALSSSLRVRAVRTGCFIG
jgi:hypothetical protein